MKSSRVNAGGVNAWLHFAVSDIGEPGTAYSGSRRCVLMSVYDRSKETVSGFWANAHRGIYLNNNVIYGPTDEPYKGFFAQVVSGKETAWNGYLYNCTLGKSAFVCRKGEEEECMYSFLMNTYKLPLLKEWMQPLLRRMKEKFLVAVGKELIGVSEEEAEKVSVDLKECGGVCRLSDIEVVRFASTFDEQVLSETLKKLHNDGYISIAKTPQKPMYVENLDEYLKTYGNSVVENMKKVVKPLTELKGTTENIALKKMRLYPQQLAVVNGAQAALKKHSFVFMNEGMGTGKTIQSLSVIEGFENQKWLDRHPGANLTDCYMSKDNVAYRTIIMSPAHLVKKWASEIRNNIPYAHVYELASLDDVIAISTRPRKATQKEFYVMGKDFAKLSFMQRPAVSKIGVRPVGKFVCDCCGTEKTQRGAQVCPNCGSTRWVLEHRYVCSKCGSVKGDKTGPCECGGNWLKKPLSAFPVVKTGLICPHCDNLVWPYQSEQKWSEEDWNPLMPEDFDKMRQINSKCYVCGDNLWEPRVSNIGGSKESKWVSMNHYSNAKHSSTSTSWVYRGREREFKERTGRMPIGEVAEKKSRKYSPASYIKKHLKGWFDYAVFDECHQYKGGGTAQGNAMEALVKASKKQLLLTGTLLNGYANAIFYLLFRVAPGLMLKRGFGWYDEMKFAKAYGVVLSKFEFNEHAYNKSSRGKQLDQPRVKPGISPMVIVDFLLPYQLTLDLSDMSEFLPPLKEKVVPVAPDPDMIFGYKNVISSLNSMMYTPQGAKCGSDKLQFALSYPDKPYLRNNIISSVDGSTLAWVPDCSKLVANGGLLSKERELIKTVKADLDEGRNSVIFVEFTSSPDKMITYRLKEILEDNIPELAGKVAIIESGKPVAKKREAWMHDRAREGVKCFITNPKNVETGLDFVWNETDEWGITTKYNYPTLIFYQCGYNLFTLWQASRRHYRLCQTEECRTYYFAYKGTIQMDVLQIMAEKQTATAAIQGKFSAEGLAKMSKQVDPRVKLAQALNNNTRVDEDSLKNMFDVLNQNNNAATDNEKAIMADYKPMPLFEEVVGALVAEETINEEVTSKPDAGFTSEYSGENFENFLEMGEFFGWFAPKEKEAVETITADNVLFTLDNSADKKNESVGQESLLDLLFS